MLLNVMRHDDGDGLKLEVRDCQAHFPGRILRRDLELQRVSNGRAAEASHVVGIRSDVLAIDADHNVADTKTGSLCGRVRLDAGNQCTAGAPNGLRGIMGNILGCQAHRAARHAAMYEDLPANSACHVDGNGKANSDVASAAGDRRIDANQVALEIDQRPA